MAYRQNNSQRSNDDIHFDLVERIGVLNTKDNGWTREVNIVSWNGGVGKVDIREWDPPHERMTKGVTLFEDEAEKLAVFLAERYGIRIDDSPAADNGRRAEDDSGRDPADRDDSRADAAEGSAYSAGIAGDAAAQTAEAGSAATA